MLSHWEDGKVMHRSVNACLCPLYAIEGMHVVTVEGEDLGESLQVGGSTVGCSRAAEPVVLPAVHNSDVHVRNLLDATRYLQVLVTCVRAFIQCRRPCPGRMDPSAASAPPDSS